MTYQQNRRYQKTIVPLIPTGKRLEIDVVSTIYPTEQTLYTVQLCELKQNEFSLQGGRFAKFSIHELPCQVTTDMSSASQSYATAFEERLEWIAQCVAKSWTFTIDIPSLSLGSKSKIVWSFEDVNDALLFKLAF